MLRTVWDFSGQQPANFTFIAGGPDVVNRHGDLASGVGLPPGTTSDFLPDETFTLYALNASPALTNIALGLVGTDVDPDGDGVTLLTSSVTSIPQRFLMAFVDATWPETSQVFDCAPIVGPDGLDVPAGGVRLGAPEPPCRDVFLPADGAGVTPGDLQFPCDFTGFYGVVDCDEAVFGQRYCSSDAFDQQTFVWGSPVLTDGNLNIGTDFALGFGVHLVSLGRDHSSLPGLVEPLCLARPWFRLPTNDPTGFGLRYEIDLTSAAQLVPIVAGTPLCLQAWYRVSVGGVPTGRLAEPVAVVLR